MYARHPDWWGMLLALIALHGTTETKYSLRNGTRVCGTVTIGFFLSLPTQVQTFSICKACGINCPVSPTSGTFSCDKPNKKSLQIKKQDCTVHICLSSKLECTAFCKTAPCTSSKASLNKGVHHYVPPHKIRFPHFASVVPCGAVKVTGALHQQEAQSCCPMSYFRPVMLGQMAIARVQGCPEKG